jgi:hypothetical protein
MDAKILIAGAWFATLWLLESRLPFFDQFPGRIKEKIQHDARNLALGAANLAITAVFFAALLSAVQTCSEKGGFGIL